MMYDESCFLSRLPRPVADPDGAALAIAPMVRAMTLAFLRKGVLPEPTRSFAEPDYVANLVQLGALRLDHETLGVTGLEPVEDPRLLGDRLAKLVGTAALKRARKALTADTAMGFDELVDAELIAFPLLPELLVGLAAAEGGFGLADVQDDCTPEERADLRRRNSDAITDWARAESATIAANFQNANDGLTLFVNFVNDFGASLESGITGAVVAAVEVVLWLFGVEVPLSETVFTALGAAVTVAGGNDAQVLERGQRSLEAARDRANDDLRRKVRELRNEVVAAGNNCPRLRDLLRKNENLPRTGTTAGLVVYRDLLVAWGRGRYGDWLTPPNPRRADPELRDKWILYGGFTDSWLTSDGYDLVDEINRVSAALGR